MKLPIHFFCPGCNTRQEVGKPGEPLELPITTRCQACNADLVIERSESLGIHARLAVPTTP